MKYLNCFLTILIMSVATSRGDQVEIQLESNPAYPRLPFIDVRFVHLYDRTQATSRMLFHTNEFYMVHPGLDGEEDSVPVGFNSEGTPVMQSSAAAPFVVRDNFVGVRSRQTPLYYGAKKSAGFAAEVGSFLLTPSGEDMKLIVRPDSPQEFCNEGSGPMVYVPTTANRSAWNVLGLIRPLSAHQMTTSGNLTTLGVDSLENRPTESIIPYSISSGDIGDKIPYETFLIIREMISATGAVIESPEIVSNGIHISNCSIHIDAFPSIQYSLYARRDIRITKTVDIVLMPREYITINGVDDTCIAHISAATDPESSAFGMNILRSATVHFDRENNRVGLCDFRDDI